MFTYVHKNKKNPDIVEKLFINYESPEGTWGFKKKAILSKSLYRIVQSVLTD